MARAAARLAHGRLAPAFDTWRRAADAVRDIVATSDSLFAASSARVLATAYRAWCCKVAGRLKLKAIAVRAVATSRSFRLEIVWCAWASTAQLARRVWSLCRRCIAARGRAITASALAGWSWVARQQRERRQGIEVLERVAWARPAFSVWAAEVAGAADLRRTVEAMFAAWAVVTASGRRARAVAAAASAWATWAAARRAAVDVFAALARRSARRQAAAVFWRLRAPISARRAAAAAAHDEAIHCRRAVVAAWARSVAGSCSAAAASAGEWAAARNCCAAGAARLLESASQRRLRQAFDRLRKRTSAALDLLRRHSRSVSATALSRWAAAANTATTLRFARERVARRSAFLATAAAARAARAWAACTRERRLIQRVLSGASRRRCRRTLRTALLTMRGALRSGRQDRRATSRANASALMRSFSAWEAVSRPLPQLQPPGLALSPEAAALFASCRAAAERTLAVATANATSPVAPLTSQLPGSASSGSGVSLVRLPQLPEPDLSLMTLFTATCPTSESDSASASAAPAVVQGAANAQKVWNPDLAFKSDDISRMFEGSRDHKHRLPRQAAKTATFMRAALAAWADQCFAQRCRTWRAAMVAERVSTHKLRASLTTWAVPQISRCWQVGLAGCMLRAEQSQRSRILWVVCRRQQRTAAGRAVASWRVVVIRHSRVDRAINATLWKFTCSALHRWLDWVTERQQRLAACAMLIRRRLRNTCRSAIKCFRAFITSNSSAAVAVSGRRLPSVSVSAGMLGLSRCMSVWSRSTTICVTSRRQADFVNRLVRAAESRRLLLCLRRATAGWATRALGVRRRKRRATRRAEWALACRAWRAICVGGWASAAAPPSDQWRAVRRRAAAAAEALATCTRRSRAAATVRAWAGVTALCSRLRALGLRERAADIRHRLGLYVAWAGLHRRADSAAIWLAFGLWVGGTLSKQVSRSLPSSELAGSGGASLAGGLIRGGILDAMVDS